MGWRKGDITDYGLLGEKGTSLIMLGEKGTSLIMVAPAGGEKGAPRTPLIVGHGLGGLLFGSTPDVTGHARATQIPMPAWTASGGSWIVCGKSTAARRRIWCGWNTATTVIAAG